MSDAPVVHLVDALPYVFRAYFSQPVTITDTAGAPANASRGFLDMLVRYLSSQQPEHIAVAFEARSGQALGNGPRRDDRGFRPRRPVRGDQRG